MLNCDLLMQAKNEKGLTLGELAKLTRIDKINLLDILEDVRDWEDNPAYIPTEEELKSLCEVLDLSINDVVLDSKYFIDKQIERFTAIEAANVTRENLNYKQIKAIDEVYYNITIMATEGNYSTSYYNEDYTIVEAVVKELERNGYKITKVKDGIKIYW